MAVVNFLEGAVVGVSHVWSCVKTVITGKLDISFNFIVSKRTDFLLLIVYFKCLFLFFENSNHGYIIGGFFNNHPCRRSEMKSDHLSFHNATVCHLVDIRDVLTRHTAHCLEISLRTHIVLKML